MYNHAKSKKTAQVVYENYNRNNSLGPQADDDMSISEKTLPHRDGFEQTVTEDQLAPEQEKTENKEAQILEKLLETTKSNYVTHRNDVSHLSVPPINVLVEKMRQKRAKDCKVDKKPNWTVTFDNKKQLGALPAFPKNAPQQKNPALNNDPSRFKGTDTNPVTCTKEEIVPLAGKITTADVHKIASGIKTGKAADFDTAILAILRVADQERRELTSVEQQTVVNLKMARNEKLLK